MQYSASIKAFKRTLATTLLSASLGAAPAIASQTGAESRAEDMQITASKSQQLNRDGATVATRRIEMGELRVKARNEADDSSAERFQKREAHLSHAYIDSAAVTLDADYDGDGYYTQLGVDFDVDTDLPEADVYARLYLSLDFGPWVEYAVSDDFTIFGASGSDGYLIETDLVEGFVPGYYDLRIEVFDAYDETLLASFDADDSSALSALPLEDELADDVGVIIESDSFIAVSSGGGGSTSALLLLSLAALGIARRLA